MDYPLFVYGTLRSGSGHAFARLLESASEFVAAGRLRGSLYRIAHYPGWVEDSDGWVRGEIWQPRDAGSLLRELDEYEGPDYRRLVRGVETTARLIECWVYLYTKSVEGKPRIHSGDWLGQQDGSSPDTVV